jgi:hypothetical protein
MAQDVTVAGAAYSDVPAVALPATGGGTASFYDVSATTATASDVAQGKQFYSASGALTTGTASGGGDGVGVFYGTCATAAATAAKAVVCEEFTSDHLVEGTVVIVKFANAQTYNGAPTLNVQSTGAKNIKRVGTTNAGRYEWQAGEVLQFVYDGSYWVLTDGGIATTTYYGVTKLSTATNSTSTALAATASAVKAAYDHASSKQNALVSGTNIKTVNGESLLGSGDLAVGGGSTVAVTQTLTSGTEIASISVDGTATKLYAPAGGGGGGNDLIIHVVVDASNNIVSHDVSNAECLDFIRSYISGEDVSATAYIYYYGYDDEDIVYSTNVRQLQLSGVSSTSYSEQYGVDGGSDITFVNTDVDIRGNRYFTIYHYKLSIFFTNDDPEFSPTVRYSYGSAYSKEEI